LLIGELTSKSDHIARIPYPDFARAVDDRAIVLCAAANTSLAGLRLSRRLSDALHRACAPDSTRKPASRGDRAFANLAAVLTDEIALTDPATAPTVERVVALHRRLLDGLDEPDGMTTASGAAESWAHDLSAAFTAEVVTDATDRVRDACQRAAAIHVATVRRRPFTAANGRMARVLEAMVFGHAGIPLRVSGCLACVYAEDTRRYRTMLRQVASNDNADTSPFVAYAVTGLVHALRDELEHVHQPMWMRQQARYLWREFVNAHFEGDTTEDAARQRQLAADLPAGGVSLATVHAVSPEVAPHYEPLNSTVVENDLEALVARTLIIFDGTSVVPRLDRVPRWIAPF
jgi:hypothetical protein